MMYWPPIFEKNIMIRKQAGLGNNQEMAIEDQSYRSMDTIAITWSIGIGIGYLFLVGLIIWISYRCFLVWSAFQIHDIVSVMTEIKIDVVIIVAYFGIGGALMKAGVL